MADDKSNNVFFLSQNAFSGPGAQRDAQEVLGEDGGLATVPYFALPPLYQPFDDTEGRFPMDELDKFLSSNDDNGWLYWYARVLPENGDPARAEYLAIHRDLSGGGGLKLVRRHSTEVSRYLATLRAGPADEGGKSP